MPLIRITFAGFHPAPEEIQSLQRRTTDLMEEILGKRRAVTVVTVDSMPAASWSVGGRSLSADSRCAHLEAFITAGTNTAEEKAEFLRAAQAMLMASLGVADGPLYLIVHELPAPDWGFDGLTQAARQQAAGSL